jgi:hypothetical protein
MENMLVRIMNVKLVKKKKLTLSETGPAYAYSCGVDKDIFVKMDNAFKINSIHAL